MSARFRHLGELWEAEETGFGVGFSTWERIPPPSSFSVVFSCVSNPSRPMYSDSITKPDAALASEQELRRALERALTKNVIEKRGESMSASDISEETGIPRDGVENALRNLLSVREDDDAFLLDDEPQYCVL